MRAVLSSPSSLLQALQQLVPGASNRTLRQMLSRGRVRLNGEITKIASHPVRRGDVIEVGEGSSRTVSLHGIGILYEDEDLLVIYKPAGLLTVSTEHEQERTAYAYLRAYLREHAPGRKLFIVHRLDKYVSGVLVFAKSESTKEELQAMFRRHSIERKYWAVVEGHMPQERGTIRSSLAEDRSGRMHSVGQGNPGKQAVTHWRVVRRSRSWTTLEVTLETGRKNQIRAHMSEIGHPIVGDKAYGSTADPFGRIALHAFRLGFVHPKKGEPVLFEILPPPGFRKYIPNTPDGLK